MVIKGSARAAPGELAYHLLREDTNELVTVLELSGVASLDLRGALAELDGMGAGSRSKRTLYHASINTPVAEQLGPDQQRIARERLADRMGLANQPYAVVQHVKHGRQHTHVVWGRIDAETGRAIHDGFNYRKHEEVARELEREFGHERVLGAHVRDKTQEVRPERAPSWAEMRQSERSGLSPAEAKEIVTGLWKRTVTGSDFRHRLEAEGFMLARGDKRDFVLIDRAGEIHGLTRRIEFVKAKEVRERMADVDLAGLPDVTEGRRQLRLRQQAQDREAAKEFTSAADRLRAEEIEREAEAKGRNRPKLSDTDQQIADAMRALGKTMRGQLEATVAGKPSWEDRREFRAELERRPEMDAQQVRYESREAPEPAISGGMEIAAPGPEATLRPSIEAEITPLVPKPVSAAPEPERGRPGVVLLEHVLGWVGDRWRRLFERHREPEQDQVQPPSSWQQTTRVIASPSPAIQQQSAAGPERSEPERRKTFVELWREQQGEAGRDQETGQERELAAQRLREELGRQDRSRTRIWVPGQTE